MAETTISILNLLAYDGPNITGPRPGILLRVWSDVDRSQRIKDVLKDGAQFIGLVISYLEIAASPAPDGEGVIICVTFATPMPALGRSLASFVVDDLRAEAEGQGEGEDQGDEEWDRESVLLALQLRRRQVSPGISVLQVVAEARKRGLPVLTLPDQQIQVGYGINSRVIEPATLNEVVPSSLLWQQAGDIPIYAVTGEHRRAALVEHTATVLQEVGQTVRVLEHADYEATLNLLSDPTVEAAVIGLQTADIVRRGLAFDRCTLSIVTDSEGTPPPDAADSDEWVRALGVPMLLSSQVAVLNMEDPLVAGLVPYAPNGVMPLSELDRVLTKI